MAEMKRTRKEGKRRRQGFCVVGYVGFCFRDKWADELDICLIFLNGENESECGL